MNPHFFNTLSSPKVYGLTVGSLQGCYCGCGALLDDTTNFKEHVMRQHKGEYIPHSSHILSMISGIVYPCKTWKKKEMKTSVTKQTIEHHENVHKTCQQSKKEEMKNQTFQRNNKYLSQSQKRESNENVTCQLFCPSQLRKYSGHNEVFVPPVPKYPQAQYSQCRSVSYQFKPTENSISNNQHSELSWQAKSDSSLKKRHFIHKSKKTQIKQRPEPVYKATQSATLKSGTQLFISTRVIAVVPANMVSIFKLLRTKQKKMIKTPSFIFCCGCQQQFHISNGWSSNQVIRHFKKDHQWKIPPNSSHILLRRNLSYGTGNYFNRLLKVVDVDDDSLGWSCPCTTDINMTRREFVEHVQEVHHGIAPAYNLTQFVKRHQMI